MKPSIELKQGSNLCVVTGYNDAFREVGELASQIKTAYCLKHRYDFKEYREGFATDRHPSWSKLLFVKDALKDYEWVFWIDADAVFTNHSKKITDLIMLGGDIFVTKEHQGVELYNCGVFLIHRCDWSNWLIDRMWNANRWLWNGDWEQSVFNELMRMNDFRMRMVYFPMRMFNSMVILKEQVCCGNRKSLVQALADERAWYPGDFIAHRISGTVEEKKRDLDDCLMKSGWKMGV